MNLMVCVLCWILSVSLSDATNRPNLYQGKAESILMREKIPLMPGLKLTGEIEDIGEGVNVFRIESEASGNIFIDDIEEFYQDSLQRVGWERIGQFGYVRNEKYLEIIPEDQSGMLRVVFQLQDKTF